MPEPVVALQARLGSTRLPGKVLRDVAGKPLLERVLEAVAGPWRVVVLTSWEPEDDRLARWLDARGQEYRRGPLEDVLARYADLARELKPSTLVRVCGDAPLLDARWVDLAIDAPWPVFVPKALHAGSWEVWGQADQSLEPEDWKHAGYYWFEKHARHIHLVPEDYFMVNTQEDLERARMVFGDRGAVR